MASVTFFKTTWHVESSGHLDYFGQEVWRHFMILLCIFLMFESWSPFTSTVWDMTALPFSFETHAMFCGLKIFTQPSISMRVSR